jgi:predicted  nucleic acid-binding Zn-ribbon protein
MLVVDKVATKLSLAVVASVLILSGCGKDKPKDVAPPGGAAAAVPMPAAPGAPAAPSAPSSFDGSKSGANAGEHLQAAGDPLSAPIAAGAKGTPSDPSWVSQNRENSLFYAMVATLDPKVVELLKSDDANFEPKSNTVQIIRPVLTEKEDGKSDKVIPGEIEFIPEPSTDGKPIVLGSKQVAFVLKYAHKEAAKPKAGEAAKPVGEHLYNLIKHDDQAGDVVVGELKVVKTGTDKPKYSAAITQLVPKPTDSNEQRIAKVYFKGDKFEDLKIEFGAIAANKKLAEEKAEAAKKAEAEAKKTDLERATERVKEAQTKLTEAVKDLEKANAGATTRTAELATAKTELGKQTNEVKRLQTEVEKSKAELEKAKAEAVASKAELDKSKAELVTARNEAKSSQDQVAGLETKVKELETKTTQQSESIQKKTKLLEDALTELGKAQGGVNQAAEDIRKELKGSEGNSKKAEVIEVKPKEEKKADQGAPAPVAPARETKPDGKAAGGESAKAGNPAPEGQPAAPNPAAPKAGENPKAGTKPGDSGKFPSPGQVAKGK